MVRRIAVAAVGIPAAVAVIHLGGWLLASMVAVLGAVGTAELYRMARHRDVRPIAAIGLLAAIGLPFLAYWSLSGDGNAPRVLLYAAPLFMILAMVATMMTRRPTQRPLAAVAVTLLGPLYASGLLSFILVLRHAGTGHTSWGVTWLVLLPLIVTWVGDSIAMAAGAVIGGPKLAPVLSPNKTWSGSIIGTAGAVALAPTYGALVLAEFGIRLEIWELVVFALVVSVAGQVGDLAESLFKREAGVKDSGRFFSGHGGVLDRLDALYWALPAAAALLELFGVQ